MRSIYTNVVNSDMKNVIGMSDPNVLFKGPGPFIKPKLWQRCRNGKKIQSTYLYIDPDPVDVV